MALSEYDAHSDVDVTPGCHHSGARARTGSKQALVLASCIAACWSLTAAADEPPPKPSPQAGTDTGSGSEPAPEAGAEAGAEAEPGAAHAETRRLASRDEAEHARTLFREGLAFVDEERWPEAADRFQRVLELRWSAAAAHNLGSALVELGKLVAATQPLKRVVADAEATPALRAAAARMLEAIEPRIGELVIEVVGGTEGLDIVLDDRTLSADATREPVPIDPGYHVVAARREGVEVAREEVYLGVGARAIAVELDPSDIPPEFEPPTGPFVSTLVAIPDVRAGRVAVSRTASSRVRDETAPWWLWIGGGALVTGLVTAAVVLIATDVHGAPEPLPGDLEPRVLRGRVAAP